MVLRKRSSLIMWPVFIFKVQESLHVLKSLMTDNRTFKYGGTLKFKNYEFKH